MKTFNFILFLILVSGCAYYSKTEVTIHAEKVKYPLGISSIQLTNGEINMVREMETKGMRK